MSCAHAVAMAVALSVSGLTRLAAADAPEPPTPTATPLTLLPSKPLELAHEPASSGLGWKLLAAAVVVAAGAAFVRSRLRSAAVDPLGLRIARRVSVGLRSELLVVEVEGQRLLLGVTGAGIQQLASLDPLEADVTATRRPVALDERFDAMLQSAENRTPVERCPPVERRPQVERRPPVERRIVAVSPARPVGPVDEATVPGQARGLLRLGTR